MLQNVLQYINNYYVDDYCDLKTVEVDRLTVKDVDLFVANQYVLVLYSKLNDGVYKIASIEDDKLILETEFDLSPESSKDMIVCSLAIPKVILSLAEEIEAYNTKVEENIQSESLGDYSVTYSGGEDGDFSWITSFRKRLVPFKKTYLTLPLKYRPYWKYVK